jgi:4-hydroxybenzoate polyprenyltransferase
MDAGQYWLQFLNVHILLFGGATAYNSFWDKDEGPIGGLKHPPKMTGWMHPVSLLFMYAGWAWAWQAGVHYFLVYGVSLILFWLYSTPLYRWKGKPHFSLVAIAFSTGVNSVILGTLAAGGGVSPSVVISALGAGLVLLSLYPVSQVFQIGEDTARGDQTFAVHYGLKGVKRFFLYSYFFGLVLLSGGLMAHFFLPGLIVFIIGSISCVIIGKIIFRMKGDREEYDSVMWVKFIASMSFVIFLSVFLVIRHGWVEIPFLQSYF